MSAPHFFSVCGPGHCCWPRTRIVPFSVMILPHQAQAYCGIWGDLSIFFPQFMQIFCASIVPSFFIVFSRLGRRGAC
jgi:hypothetical protein